MKIILETHRAH